jgi:hypothetical protein
VALTWGGERQVISVWIEVEIQAVTMPGVPENMHPTTELSSIGVSNEMVTLVPPVIDPDAGVNPMIANMLFN